MLYNEVVKRQRCFQTRKKMESINVQVDINSLKDGILIFRLEIPYQLYKD
jgi:hypothetical protein